MVAPHWRERGRDDRHTILRQEAGSSFFGKGQLKQLHILRKPAAHARKILPLASKMLERRSPISACQPRLQPAARPNKEPITACVPREAAFRNEETIARAVEQCQMIQDVLARLALTSSITFHTEGREGSKKPSVSLLSAFNIGGVNGTSPRKSTDQWNRPGRLPHAKSGPNSKILIRAALKLTQRLFRYDNQLWGGAGTINIAEASGLIYRVGVGADGVQEETASVNILKDAVDRLDCRTKCVGSKSAFTRYPFISRDANCTLYWRCSGPRHQDLSFPSVQQPRRRLAIVYAAPRRRATRPDNDVQRRDNAELGAEFVHVGISTGITTPLPLPLPTSPLTPWLGAGVQLQLRSRRSSRRLPRVARRHRRRRRLRSALLTKSERLPFRIFLRKYGCEISGMVTIPTMDTFQLPPPPWARAARSLLLLSILEIGDSSIASRTARSTRFWSVLTVRGRINKGSVSELRNPEWRGQRCKRHQQPMDRKSFREKQVALIIINSFVEPTPNYNETLVVFEVLNSQTNNLKWGGGAVAKRLACSPPTKANRVQSPAGSLPDFACESRAGRCRWSTGFHGDHEFPPPLHSGAAPFSPHFTLIGS
ncbi:hypothetical protein PR048_022368 [Dryococelus australis]|uniref:Uncharacterized protein n=1 Tax=Dryococelus australis TaxID=614101 RepID=A0ABQ9H0V0_9NEOP|nr:hypothetical protein PR048_022368 [Dryococelus australis]